MESSPKTQENIPPLSLQELATKLEEIQNEKTAGKGDVVMQKLIRRLLEGGADAAKIFLANESDKFSSYRKDALPLIVANLYGGSGSPWPSLEKK